MNDWPLGKNIAYETKYNPKLLIPVPRQLTRENIGIEEPLPFKGVDIWNAWELSWLNTKGKPMVANGRFQYSADSTFLIESKSLKLYLNSLNQSKFASRDEVLMVIKRDLSEIIEYDVEVTLYDATEDWPGVQNGIGISLDDIDVNVTTYELSPDYLLGSVIENTATVSEDLFSHLFKSNCMVTGQPDWASIFISYTGLAINHPLLLQYLISFRNHQAFHEPCVEKIFVDLIKYCKPQSLSVYCRYSRRGGIDINPFRSTTDQLPSNQRIWRQ